MTELNKHFDPAELEARWYAWWQEKGLFHDTAEPGDETYCVVIPPPNVTGILHMGHALNNTIQDVLVRWQRMKGRKTVWVPGTDHAGIATQNVVERQLKSENLTRDDLGREKFVERVWSWREEYGSTIINQLKRLGFSCDWERERFTMDEGLSRAVVEVFVRLYDKGLIYKGNYIINWCPRCQTALSDEESEHQEMDGKLYYLRYPIQGGRPSKDYVVVATTRPETLLGDVAVAMNPRDERFQSLRGNKLVLPVLGRELVVIEDDFVDPEFGTGLVKVTPAHDPNDFEMGQRHGLESVNVMNEDGTMNEEAGPYAGLDRMACRKRILEDLADAGLIEEVKEHRHAVGHCYRCHTMVEPRLSPQWFVKMQPLAGPALEAVKTGRVQFVPDRWTKVYLEWMENIRDWCISRQIWWGHRIPVYTCDACGKEWAARETPSSCSGCGAETIRQDPDVLDTWFSSWLWPFSVFGWPEKNADLEHFYPTQTLSTASEIIFFWVARMVMAGLEFMGDIPFSKVYIHGTVRDDHGRKMSKSLGNSIDPIDIIDKYSADALRFSLIMLTATGQDVYVSDEKFEIGRNFGTKIWNAARFMKMHADAPPAEVHDPDFASMHLSADDQHILARLHATMAACDDALERCRFNDMAKALYEFTWHQFCDRYVEYAKDALYGDDPARKADVLKVMHYVLSNALRLLHPLMPFLTEELWHGMGYNAESESIMRAPWPVARDAAALAEWGIAEENIAYVDGKHDLIRVARTLRADYNLPPSKKIDYIVRPAGPAEAERLREDASGLASLARAGTIRIEEGFVPPVAMPSGLSALGNVFMPLEGLVDVEAEVEKLTAQLDKLDAEMVKVGRKLENEKFVSKAPAHVVEQQRARGKDLAVQHEKVRKLRDALKGAESPRPD